MGPGGGRAGTIVAGHMVGVGLGAAAAVAASTLFSVGLVLQSLEARTLSAEHSLGRSLMGRLLRRPRWLAGAAVMLTGFGFHVVALLLAPLTVVQPALAAGLVVLLAAGVRLDADPIRTRDLAGVAGIGVGVVGVALTAPERTTSSSSPLALAVGLGSLATVALVPHAMASLGSARREAGTLLAAYGAGAAYALTGLTTKLVSDRLAVGDWVGTSAWLVTTALAAAVALVDQTTALRHRGTTEVGAIVYVMPVLVPVVLAPLLVGEGWGSPLDDAVLVLSVAGVCAGAAVLAGSRPVSAVDRASTRS